MTTEIKTHIEIAENKAHGDHNAVLRCVGDTLSNSDLVKGLQGQWALLVRPSLLFCDIV